MTRSGSTKKHKEPKGEETMSARFTKPRRGLSLLLIAGGALLAEPGAQTLAATPCPAGEAMTLTTAAADGIDRAVSQRINVAGQTLWNAAAARFERDIAPRVDARADTIATQVARAQQARFEQRVDVLLASRGYHGPVTAQIAVPDAIPATQTRENDHSADRTLLSSIDCTAAAGSGTPRTVPLD